ncbi:acyl-CoA dehydrogenase family protein [Geodermatophilus obscurus]|uniref:Acyl-CoA dehydrogenase domain protein n=1 Tax=Geodermatophilus obscurus (strain ATCC 25078 / DSM 43160 / JCM 3152 / CCUG 61914 / KCC A-0152 / KCTC 9177 / NBRC 13315 / NRRL B-3577 / G-20) TaxID=526225 RepID=D2SD36_GEOOG|nr:acyl-CoA dehydrogenase family protein [Geodermatophilus obscurus]ADB76385.1 acyl-CoA dehydrogenase domain protein [Geodermatophilus obscurus DSM 43160]
MSSPLTLAPAPPSQAAEEVRAQVREFLAEELAAGTFTTHVDTWLSGVDPAFSRKLGERGWLGMTWPKQYGGHERSAMERYAVTEELLAAGAPVAAHWIADRQSGPNLLRYGTEAQRRDILPRIAAGECYFVIGMSEPDSGSDLASIRTRAARNGDGDWVVNGAKVWTSNAHFSHYGIVLVRTSPADPANRHAGLSQLLVDLSLPGISINPIRILDGGHHFNEVVFEDVVVPGDMLLGEEGAGWHQVTAELAFERSGPERFLSTYPLVAEFARRACDTGDAAQLATLGRLSARLLALRQLSLRIAAALDRGELPDIPAALVKDVGTTFEADAVDEIRRVVEVTVSLESPDPLGRALAEAQLHAPGYTLRGGTNEILRGIVARGLGLR